MLARPPVIVNAILYLGYHLTELRFLTHTSHIVGGVILYRSKTVDEGFAARRRRENDPSDVPETQQLDHVF
jgi:hypothetical protein